MIIENSHECPLCNLIPFSPGDSSGQCYSETRNGAGTGHLLIYSLSILTEHLDSYMSLVLSTPEPSLIALDQVNRYTSSD